MAASLRLTVFAMVGLCLLPATCRAQGLFGGGHVRLFGGRPATGQEIENHLRGYQAGLHNHGGYGYGGGGGYAYGGAAGGTYGGIFFPGFGNTYGFYPYGNGYYSSSPNYSPAPRIFRPAASLPSNSAPVVSAPVPAASEPMSLPTLPAAPLIDSSPVGRD